MIQLFECQDIWLYNDRRGKMPQRAVVARELANVLGVLAHPHRVRIIQELRNGELDVNSLQEALEVSHSRVSQHLSVLRSHRLVVERREGRHVYYRLVHTEMARWLLDGLKFVAQEQNLEQEIRQAVDASRQMWTA
jgi:DNA-binding transcriptional ArsR family regulator